MTRETRSPTFDSAPDEIRAQLSALPLPRRLDPIAPVQTFNAWHRPSNGDVLAIIARGEEVMNGYHKGQYSEQQPPPELFTLIPPAVHFGFESTIQRWPMYSCWDDPQTGLPRQRKLIPFLPDPVPFDTSNFETALYMSLGATSQDLLDRTRKDDAMFRQTFQSRVDKGKDVSSDVRSVYTLRNVAYLQEMG